ncbi:response regulator transcription factor [Rivularia sp. UHCC 0363]|uniref:response regulator transcription factor n=1 Tax=Rivularia sp. UHCC 0363 TaxID=3110244 RepID=UPI002B201EB2|nr:response regulator transcription factor [Rivularia sp. UHCC 0363]MEA5598683.1 response regulator transcription factor [Rivularia sp. UHCC 0363]
MSEISIVLIEDHDLTRMGIKAALQTNPDLRIIGEAANATRGLKMLETMKPDVALIDIGLPDTDGIELTRKFREFQSSRGDTSTKILVLTMNHTNDTVLAAFAAGADSYYMKDTSIDKLTEAIYATYSGNSWIDPAIANIVLNQIRDETSENKSSAQSKTVKIGALASEYEQVLETYPLTQRELEILELIVAGHSNGEIAEKLYITVGTVKTHVRNILNKLCADDRTQAAVRALRSGLVA